MFFEEAGNYAARKVTRTLTDESQTNTIKVPMLESKDYTFSSIETNSQTEWITGIDVSLPMFTIGNLNIVEFDGREYECETSARGGGGRYVGFGRSSLSDTGANEPFSVRLDTKEGRMMVSCYTDAGLPEGTQRTHTFAVYDTETIHPISEKYLPKGFGGGGPIVVDFDALGIGDAFNELIDKGGGSTQVTFPTDFWRKIHRDSLVIMSVEIAAYGFCMCTLMGNYNISDEDVVFRLFAKEIIDGSLITVTLDALSSSLSVAMIKLS